MATYATCSASFGGGNGNVTMTMTRTGVNVDGNYDLWTATLTRYYKWNINSNATKYGSMWANGALIWSGGVISEEVEQRHLRQLLILESLMTATGESILISRSHRN